ncbi:uncharacterized protein TNCV_3012171 [Trichonephila clavipes]|nr:uncharacterized protein TNCV_3012171 [Trichonephila clavipes]
MANAMSSSKVRKWVRAFKDGRENVHDEPRLHQILINAVDEKIREDRRFTISTLALEFPNVESKRQSMEWRHTNFRVKGVDNLNTQGYGNRVLG